MRKHAYLFTVHGNLQVLKVMIALIDDLRNDIFILIDKKSPKDFKEAVEKLKCQYSRIVIVPSIKIYWAGVSLIYAQLLLLQAALKKSRDYEYLHYIEGADLPLKNQQKIHEFFHKNFGKQFVEYNPNLYEFAKYKVYYYHFFVDNRFFRKNKIVKIWNHGCARIQKSLHLKRREDKIYAGSALYSITSDCASYLLKNAKRILQEYRFTLAADEVWIQTELMKSPYKKQIYRFEESCYGNVRYILWDRKRKNHNSPYTFTNKDFYELKQIAETTELCFARKFEEQEDMEIVCKIEKMIQESDGYGENK